MFQVNRPVTPTSIHPSLRQHQDYQNFDQNSPSEFDNDEYEFVEISSKKFDNFISFEIGFYS